MPRLSELTDFDPMGNATGIVPVAEPAAIPSPLSNNVDKILNALFRPDEKRLQLWPEKLLREGITAAGDVASGKVPTMAIDPATGDVHTSPQMIEKAQAVAALAGTGGLGGTGKARLSTKDLEKVNTDPMPAKFKAGTKDDTGIWFLDGDKPIYAQAKRDSLDKLFGDRAKEFDNFKSVSGTNDKGHPISVWYREGSKEAALKEIQNFKDKAGVKTKAEEAKLHYESGINLGYPEEAARAYAYKRFGVDPAPGGEVVLGATPSLRPALKHKEKLYKGKPGQEHQDIIPNSLYDDFQKKAMSGEDLAEYNFGFVNDKGHFLSREDALKYGIDNGLIDQQAGKFGTLTSTMFADSSKPGVAIEALKNYPLAKPSDRWTNTTGQNDNLMQTMTPDDFLSKARPLKIDAESRETINDLKKHIKEGKPLDPLELHANGKEDGRHRAIAAKELGIKEVPVINFRSDTANPLPPGYELKPVDYNPFELKT